LCHLNLAAVFLKTKDYKGAMENSTKALAIDPNNVKGLWRRGTAHTYLGDLDVAKVDLEAALQLDPENKAVKASYAQLKKKIANADKKDRKRYENLFHRLAEVEKAEQEQKLEEEKKEEEKRKVEEEEKKKHEKKEDEKKEEEKKEEEKKEEEKTEEDKMDVAEVKV